MDTPRSGPSNRPPQQPRWSVTELTTLIIAKHAESARNGSDKGRGKTSKTAHGRWAEIANQCKGKGLIRTGNQCKKRWEKLVTDYKRIYDHQKTIPTGHPGYFQMVTEEKKLRRLPQTFHQKIYDLMMMAFVPNHRVVNPDPDQIADTTIEEESLNMDATALDVKAITHLEEEVMADAANSSPSHPTSEEDAHAASDRLDSDNQNPTEDPTLSNESRPPEGSVGGWRRSKKSKYDDSFTKAISSFIDVIAGDALKRNLYEQEYLALEKKKHALEVSKHEEHLARQERISGDISGALKDVSESLRFFATEIAKKM